MRAIKGLILAFVFGVLTTSCMHMSRRGCGCDCSKPAQKSCCESSCGKSADDGCELKGKKTNGG